MAFLSPALGPAAAGPAAASAATVAAQAPVASLDVGAWNLPGDMMAQLHAGEMVVPATFAEGLRGEGGIGGSGGNFNITIQAIDTQTGAAFLKNNANIIAQSLSNSSRNFNKNVPAWKQ